MLWRVMGDACLLCDSCFGLSFFFMCANLFNVEVVLWRVFPNLGQCRRNLLNFFQMFV